MAMFNSFLYVYQRVHTFTIWLWHSQFAMENPQNKWRFLAGNIIYKWAIYTMAMYAFPALFLRPADCGTLRDHLMTADVPSFVSACSHSCPACCFTHIYNHIWYIYTVKQMLYIYITYHYLTTSICRIEFYLRLRRIIEVPKTVWLILTRIKDGSRTFALSAWSQWAGRESRYHLSHDAQNLALL